MASYRRRRPMARPIRERDQRRDAGRRRTAAAGRRGEEPRAERGDDRPDRARRAEDALGGRRARRPATTAPRAGTCAGDADRERRALDDAEDDHRTRSRASRGTGGRRSPIADQADDEREEAALAVDEPAHEPGTARGSAGANVKNVRPIMPEARPERGEVQAPDDLVRAAGEVAADAERDRRDEQPVDAAVQAAPHPRRVGRASTLVRGRELRRMRHRARRHPTSDEHRRDHEDRPAIQNTIVGCPVRPAAMPADRGPEHQAAHLRGPVQRRTSRPGARAGWRRRGSRGRRGRTSEADSPATCAEDDERHGPDDEQRQRRRRTRPRDEPDDHHAACAATRSAIQPNSGSPDEARGRPCRDDDAERRQCRRRAA